MSKPAKRKKPVRERYKSRGGRPSYQPTDKDRETVRTMTAYGINATDVAKCVGIGRTTLFKYYLPELETSHIHANAQVAQTAFQLAKSGKCPAATFFWLKTRAGWREVQRMEHSGAIGQYDLTKISDADLERLESILGPLADAGGSEGGEGAA